MSSWTLILLTSERLISVWIPFKCKELCSRRRIILTWTAITVLLFGANVHFFVTVDLLLHTPQGSDVEQLGCDVHYQFRKFFGLWYWIDALLADFIPFLVVLAGNCAIVAKIVMAHRQRTEHVRTSASDVRKVSRCVYLFYASSRGFVSGNKYSAWSRREQCYGWLC